MPSFGSRFCRRGTRTVLRARENTGRPSPTGRDVPTLHQRLGRGRSRGWGMLSRISRELVSIAPYARIRPSFFFPPSLFVRFSPSAPLRGPSTRERVVRTGARERRSNGHRNFTETRTDGILEKVGRRRTGSERGRAHYGPRFGPGSVEISDTEKCRRQTTLVTEKVDCTFIEYYYQCRI